MTFIDETIERQYNFTVPFYCGEIGKTVEAYDCFNCHRELFCPYKTFRKK
jgi:hypothetical protein